MKHILFLVLLGVSCTKAPRPVALTNYVDPFIGTGGHGHTFPGATVPFGMVQLSPDGDVEGWDWCSGYHYSDTSLMGFSHTHLSGTGIGDMGDVLLMPFTGATFLTPGPKNDPDAGYRSRFSHEQEVATPGYYQVTLLDTEIAVELTATERAGFHRYQYPEGETPKLLLDLEHGIGWDEPTAASLEQKGDSLLVGHRSSKGWAKDQRLYFAMAFSEPMANLQLYDSTLTLRSGKAITDTFVKSVVTFKPPVGQLLVKVGLSYTSAEAALRNLNAEIPDWDFEAVKQAAQEKWEAELGKIQVSTEKREDKVKFYTALYHTFLYPQLFNDVDGAYRGADGAVHPNPGFDMYSIYSLWDTFRALHPLFTLVQRERTAAMAQSMVQVYKDGGLLPKWELVGNETGTMIGYHAVPVLGEAFLKGLYPGDGETLLKAMRASAEQADAGIQFYGEHGYVAADTTLNSVSKHVEYAYDDWVIAQVASALGDTLVESRYAERAQYYKNLFDAESGFMRGKNADGSWVTPFNPAELQHTGTFIEGNSMQYTWFVPHDVPGLMELMGGTASFEAKLDQLFQYEGDERETNKVSDVTGLIGMYAHGNEPSHHVAYLYNAADRYDKTQRRLQEILDGMYGTGPDGLAGNEDCGQMSAWYVMSAMGFYPVNPVSLEYELGWPIFKEVQLSNGNLNFTISNSATDLVRKVFLNGKTIEGTTFPYDALKQPKATLHFE